MVHHWDSYGQAYERLIRPIKHWFNTDQNNKFDPADIKAKIELLF